MLQGVVLQPAISLWPLLAVRRQGREALLTDQARGASSKGVEVLGQLKDIAHRLMVTTSYHTCSYESC